MNILTWWLWKAKATANSVSLNSAFGTYCSMVCSILGGILLPEYLTRQERRAAPVPSSCLPRLPQPHQAESWCSGKGAGALWAEGTIRKKEEIWNLERTWEEQWGIREGSISQQADAWGSLNRINATTQGRQGEEAQRGAGRPASKQPLQLRADPCFTSSASF